MTHKVVIGYSVATALALVLLVPAVVILWKISVRLKCLDLLMISTPVFILLTLLAKILENTYFSYNYSTDSTLLRVQHGFLEVLVVLAPQLFEDLGVVSNLFLWNNFFLGSRYLSLGIIEEYYKVRRLLICSYVIAQLFSIIIPYAIIVWFSCKHETYQY